MGNVSFTIFLGIAVTLNILAQSGTKTGTPSNPTTNPPVTPVKPLVAPSTGQAKSTKGNKGVPRTGMFPYGRFARLEELRRACQKLTNTHGDPIGKWKAENQICESTPAIPTAGGRVAEITILSAARIVKERADHRGEFLFEFECTSRESYVDIEVSTVLNPAIAAQSRQMKTAQPCASPFAWKPEFGLLTGDTPNLNIRVTEVRPNGDLIVISPIIHARKTRPADQLHNVTVVFPSQAYQALAFQPEAGAALETTIRGGSTRLTAAVDAGTYRIMARTPSGTTDTGLRLKITGRVR